MVSADTNKNHVRRRLKMKTLTTQIKRFFQEEDGVTAIEYALIAAVTALAIIGTFMASKASLETIFDKISVELGLAAG
jgi:pilus assembly protein Flp/PilA